MADKIRCKVVDNEVFECLSVVEEPQCYDSEDDE